MFFGWITVQFLIVISDVQLSHTFCEVIFRIHYHKGSTFIGGLITISVLFVRELRAWRSLLVKLSHVGFAFDQLFTSCLLCRCMH